VGGGRFALTSLLGQGGMGSVYGGQRVKDGAPVAIKIVDPGHQQSWKASELFERSARVLQGLSLPGVPEVYAFERDVDGRLVLVRERFDGGTLSERVAQQAHLKPGVFRHLSEALLRLLKTLHGLVPPVIHRDIKPSNIMFRSPSDWEPVLVDFDTVRSPGAGDGLTIVGTPGYAAPEQFSGDATARSDLYGLGATLLFVATHVPADALPRHSGRFDVEHLLGSVPPDLKRLLLTLVEPDPTHRPESAAEALAALAGAPPAPAQEPKPAHPRQAQPSGEQGQAMVNYLLEAFRRDAGIDGRRDRLVVQRVQGVVPEVLRTLRTAGRVRVDLPFLSADHGGPKHLQLDLVAAPDGGWREARSGPDDGTVLPPRQAAVSGPATLRATKVALALGAAVAMLVVLGAVVAMLTFRTSSEQVRPSRPAVSAPAVAKWASASAIARSTIMTCDLSSDPPGAKVFWRGAQLGRTPLELRTRADELPYSVVLTAPKHRNQTVSFEAEDFRYACSRRVVLEPSAGWGHQAR